MAAPIVMHTAADVSARLHELVQVQTQVAQELNRADAAAVQARLAYDHGYSRAFIQGEGSMDLRRQMALEASYVLRVVAENADLMVRNLKRRLDALRTEIDVARTVGATIRSETQAFGSMSAGVR
jgi:hypothetical protein